ncbi:hypothetical protein B0H66DRAFT_283123 [Apodospora peruviana]|uniref:PAS domain-containing protein n=1 Tax=Apodospora peruviana TaxID=516989 RepID=A0AAE0I0B2_9PEZI|nr:hypothetical protein B0H66DRAFT_283123 [Apodospora peruviana]
MTMNYWEQAAYESSSTTSNGGVFHPTLYAPSSYNIMQILAQIWNRPNPQVDLGPVDMSCPIVVCDMQKPDQPIVYASEPFYELTGYTDTDVIGKNCRMLQAPGGKVKPMSARKYVDKESIKKMRKAVEKFAELQLDVVNFKKNGEAFTNRVAIIPVQWEDHSYCVGFMNQMD